jgi:hypothetical protein
MIAKALVLFAVAAALWIWWRRNSRSRPAMSASEARALLGVSEAATLKEVREAHRRLISRVHPDAGGSAELATRVNAARDRLVEELSRAPARRD